MLGHLGDFGVPGPVLPIRLGDGSRHPPEQVSWTLDGSAGLVLQEIALFEDRNRIRRQPDRVPWGGRFHSTPRLGMKITKRVGATLLHHRTSQPKRKAKLGSLPDRDNTTKNSRRHVQSHCSHHKYSLAYDVEKVDD